MTSRPKFATQRPGLKGRFCQKQSSDSELPASQLFFSVEVRRAACEISHFGNQCGIADLAVLKARQEGRLSKVSRTIMSEYVALAMPLSTFAEQGGGPSRRKGSRASILQLPTSLLTHILSFSDGYATMFTVDDSFPASDDLQIAAVVDKTLNKAAYTERLWKHLVNLDAGTPLSDFKSVKVPCLCGAACCTV